MNAIKQYKKMVVYAGAAAQKATDFILNKIESKSKTEVTV